MDNWSEKHMMQANKYHVTWKRVNVHIVHDSTLYVRSKENTSIQR